MCSMASSRRQATAPVRSSPDGMAVGLRKPNPAVVDSSYVLVHLCTLRWLPTAGGAVRVYA